MIILRNSGHGANIRICMEYLRSGLGGVNTGKFLIKMTYLASKVYFLLSVCYFVLISGHLSELSLPRFPVLSPIVNIPKTAL